MSPVLALAKSFSETFPHLFSAKICTTLHRTILHLAARNNVGFSGFESPRSLICATLFARGHVGFWLTTFFDNLHIWTRLT